MPHESKAVREKRNEIRAYAALLLDRHGQGIEARGEIVLTLMREYGISDESALQYIRHAKQRTGQATRAEHYYLRR